MKEKLILKRHYLGRKANFYNAGKHCHGLPTNIFVYAFNVPTLRWKENPGLESAFQRLVKDAIGANRNVTKEFLHAQTVKPPTSSVHEQKALHHGIMACQRGHWLIASRYLKLV